MRVNSGRSLLKWLTEVKAKLQGVPDSWLMQFLKQTRAGFVTFIFASLFTINVFAHTLPISYLTVVPDQTHVHVELTFNPFELNFFSELDANKDGVLDSAELNSASQNLSDRILQQLKFTADGKLMSAENAGVFGEAGGHHLTFRAHFPTGKPDALLAIDSNLGSITSASHLTEVTFGKAGEHQLARLDSQKQHASFGSKSKKPQVAATTVPIRDDPAGFGFLVILPLTFLPMICAFFLLQKFTAKRLPNKPA